MSWMLSNINIVTTNTSFKKNIISSKNIIIDSKSGYSGAGRGVHKKYKNKNLYDSLSVYGIKTHRHNSEIQQEFDIEIGKKVEFTFTPHLSQCLEEF